MRKTRTLGIAAGAIIAVLLTAIPASAYYVTGWQTNNGWNSIDGCNVSRIRGSAAVSAEDYLCARDVGVRGKGTDWFTGKPFETPFITWGSHYAQEYYSPEHNNYSAMKVYHGDH